MRDPDRIDPVLSTVRRLWEKYPDMRLGQLLVNVAHGDDMFNLEDEELVLRLHKVFASGWEQQ